MIGLSSANNMNVIFLRLTWIQVNIKLVKYFLETFLLLKRKVLFWRIKSIQILLRSMRLAHTLSCDRLIDSGKYFISDKCSRNGNFRITFESFFFKSFFSSNCFLYFHLKNKFTFHKIFSLKTVTNLFNRNRNYCTFSKFEEKLFVFKIFFTFLCSAYY